MLNEILNILLEEEKKKEAIDEILTKLLEEERSKEVIKEWSSGAAKVGAKYLKRIGTPGNYTYIYSNRKVEKLGRKARAAYGRLIDKNIKLFNRLKMRFDPRSFQVSPSKQWYHAAVKMNLKNGDLITMRINMKNTSIIGYRRSRRGQGLPGYPIQIAKAKKKGILRYKGVSI